MCSTAQLRRLFVACFLVGSFAAVQAQEPVSSNPSAAGRSITDFQSPLFCRVGPNYAENICTARLAKNLDSKKLKAGTSVLLAISYRQMGSKKVESQMEAQVIAAESRDTAHSESSIKLQFTKALDLGGRVTPIEARILAVASEAKVHGGWAFPAIIVDSYPHDPTVDERRPGELKEDPGERRSSLLDSIIDVPIFEWCVCRESEKPNFFGVANPCAKLEDAQGAYGYKGMRIEVLRTGNGTVSQLVTRKKNLNLKKGTIFVLAVRGLPGAMSISH